MSQNKQLSPENNPINLGQLVARVGYALSVLNSTDRHYLTQEIELKCSHIANGYPNTAKAD